MRKTNDAPEPDCRSRLVACEMNKTGENHDLFYASAPTLEATKAMLAGMHNMHDKVRYH